MTTLYFGISFQSETKEMPVLSSCKIRDVKISVEDFFTKIKILFITFINIYNKSYFVVINNKRHLIKLLYTFL